MSRNDYIMNKPDSKDVEEYNKIVQKALFAKRKIETGFLELAECIYDIHKTKLYRIKYKTFAEFCDEELGFSRQTIYVYISILKLIGDYQEYFPREKAVDLGHKKMRFISEGINAIDKMTAEEKIKEQKKIQIFQKVNPSMSSTEVEALIEDIITDH